MNLILYLRPGHIACFILKYQSMRLKSIQTVLKKSCDIKIPNNSKYDTVKGGWHKICDDLFCNLINVSALFRSSSEDALKIMSGKVQSLFWLISLNWHYRYLKQEGEIPLAWDSLDTPSQFILAFFAYVRASPCPTDTILSDCERGDSVLRVIGILWTDRRFK